MIVDGDSKAGIIQETSDDTLGHRRQDMDDPHTEHWFLNRPRDILTNGLQRYVR
jgi:hypothetical protein